jgi:hypothetical protein
MSIRPPSRIRSRQIGEADIGAVADLLLKGFGRRRTREFWLAVLDRLTQYPTPAGLPKYGYGLESDGALVGVVLLISTEIGSANASSTRCNVSSWYVEPEFRGYAPLLAAQASRHQNVTYLNISPMPHTRPIVEALGYELYSRGIVIAAPLLQTPFHTNGVRIVDADAPPDALHETFEQKLLADHAAHGCISFWCVNAERAYPFVFRPRLLKGLIPYAQLVYCRAVDDLVRFAGPIGWELARHGRPLVMIDANGPIRGLLGKYLHDVKPKYCKGPDRPRLGDLAYTETALFGV